MSSIRSESSSKLLRRTRRHAAPAPDVVGADHSIIRAVIGNDERRLTLDEVDREALQLLRKRFGKLLPGAGATGSKADGGFLKRGERR